MDQWTTTYAEAIKIPIGEVAGVRPMRDFLMAIRQREPIFADAHLITLKHKINSDELFELIEDFRQHIHLSNLLHPSKSGEHAAFLTGSGLSFRGQSQSPQPTRLCVCGDTHWISNCHYLVPETKPRGWKPDENKLRNIDDALKDSRTKAWVDRVLERKKRQDNQSSQGTSTPSSLTIEATNFPEAGAFTCVVESAAFSSTASRNTKTLKASWILDNGTNIHVCNRTMLSRFIKTRDAGPFDTLRAGTQIIPIECFGTVRITIKAPTPVGYAIMTLLNVAYVSEFMTNLVSQSILASKGVYFDGWKNQLHREGTPIGFVESLNGHYILEKNLEPVTQEVIVKNENQPSKCNTPACSKTGQVLSDEPDRMQLTVEPFTVPDTTISDILDLYLDLDSDLDSEKAYLPIPDNEQLSLPKSPVTPEAPKASELSIPPSSQPSSQMLFLPSLPPLSDTSTIALPSAERTNEVSANLDEANILREGVTTRRKKTRKKRCRISKGGAANHKGVRSIPTNIRGC